MKGLSVEEKAKRYDELLLKLQKAKVDDDVCDEMYYRVIDDIVPELKESEDERIRKVLVDYFKRYKEQEECGIKTFFGIPIDNIIAWLEKQGEQKPVDKVEPKFKVGDWIIDVQGVSANQIIGYEDDSYYIETSCSKFYLPMKLAEKNYRLWTIQDAKNGDVLATGQENIFIFKSISDCVVCDYCGLYYGKFMDCSANVNSPKSAPIGFHPATKEQRDLLFQKMKEEGYVWDSEKKQLRKNEEKVDNANKVDPKFKAGDWIVRELDNSVHQVKNALESESNGKYAYDLTDGGYISTSHDSDYHLWTILDAKAGDVIYSRHNTEDFEWIGIFKSLDEGVHFYGFWNNLTKAFKVCNNEIFVLYDDFSPATKEQREQLEKAMADAGYAFDFDKKELKKIDTKLNDESVSNELREASFAHAEKEVLNPTFPNSEEFELAYTFEEGAKWDAAQKPTWSEEDESMLFNVINRIEQLDHYWNKPTDEKLIDWFKSIKGRYTWKPSDEQMKTLLSEVKGWIKGCPKQIVLESLYQDLKKLK